MSLAKAEKSVVIGPHADQSSNEEEGLWMFTGGLPGDPDKLCLYCRNLVREDVEVSDDVIAVLEACNETEERAEKCHELRGLLCPLSVAADAHNGVRRGWLYRSLKRGIDILGGLVGSLLMLLFLPLIALVVKIQSPGNIFFAQERVGLDGKPFRLYKFRTMHENIALEARWASEEEDRIFSFGSFMRRLHIDEFPQFLNVLVGSMSLVGPRPEQLPMVERLSAKIPNYDKRHCVLPGLTGWAQMRHGYAGCEMTSWLKTASDLYYIKHRSLWLDVSILLRTIPAVLIKEQSSEYNARTPAFDQPEDIRAHVE